MRRTCALALSLPLALALAACSPEIVPGAYLCGPEQDCPEDLACDGVEDVCVLPSAAQPFACASPSEREPNDVPDTAQSLGDITGCISSLIELAGCTQDADGEDWYAFEAPASCTAVGVRLRLSYRSAYEVLGLALHGPDGAVLATGGPCANDAPGDADDLRCLDHTLTPGERYTVRVHRSGEGSCDGACAFNRYLLNAQLVRP